MTVSFWALIPFLIAAILLAVWRPRVALLLPLVFHAGYLVRSRILFGDSELSTTLLEVLIGVAVLSGILSARSRIGSALRALPRPVLVCALAFVISATVSAIVAPHPRTAWGQWKAFVVEPIAYAAMLVPFLQTAKGRLAVAGALLWGGIVSAGLSFLSVATCSLPAPRSFSGVGFTAHCPLTPDFFRLRGIYDVPNSLALVLAPLTVFAAVLAFGAHSPVRRLSRVCLALFVPALLLTQSFGGLLAAVVTGIVTAWRARNLLQYTKVDFGGPQRRWWESIFSRRQIVIAVIIAIAASGVFLSLSSGKLAHALAAHSPLRARLQIWGVSLSLVRDHPILGTGLGTFEPTYQAKLQQLLTRNSELGTHRSQFPVPSPQFPLEWVVRDPHNIFLSFWLNAGLLGLVSMAGLVFSALRQLPKFLRSTSEVGVLPAASVAALLTLLLFGLVDTPYFKNDLALLWWTYLVGAYVEKSSRDVW